MRTMILSLTLFALLFSFILINAARISEIRGAMLELLDCAEPDLDGCYESIYALREYWSASRRAVDVSVPRQSVTRIHELICSLECYLESGERAEFDNTKKLLKSAIEELGRLELFDLENIM